MRRRINLRTFAENASVVGGVTLIALLVANLISFFTTRSLLPLGSQLGDVDIGGLSIDDAVSKTVTSLATPVVLRSTQLTETGELVPAQVDFRMNDVIVRLQLQAVIERQQRFDRFPGFVVRQYGSPAQIAIPYQYSDPKLQEVVAALAQQFGREARAATPDLAGERVLPAQDGAQLSAAEASRAILAALSSANERTVELPIDTIATNAINLQSLAPQLLERLQAFSSVDGNLAVLFIKDLQSGDELSVNGDVAVSASGWLKLALVAHAAGAYTVTLGTEQRTQLTAIAAQGDNATADGVLRELGGGDAQGGIDQLNRTLNKIGLRNTFLAQPFGQSVPPPSVITPANARGDVNASPNPNAQSTVADMGVLLESLFACSQGKGALILIDPEAFDVATCQTILGLAGGHSPVGLIRGGTGEKATVIHRQSWDETNHGDAALIISPKRTYLIAIMLHGRGTLNWADTSPIISDVARTVYGFYNGDLPPAGPTLSGPPSP